MAKKTKKVKTTKRSTDFQPVTQKIWDQNTLKIPLNIFSDMVDIITKADSLEVGFYLLSKSDDFFNVVDLYFPKQEVHEATTEFATDFEESQRLIQAMGAINMETMTQEYCISSWVHSHNTMPTDPSYQDNVQIGELTATRKMTRMIINHYGEITCSLFGDIIPRDVKVELVPALDGYEPKFEEYDERVSLLPLQISPLVSSVGSSINLSSEDTIRVFVDEFIDSYQFYQGNYDWHFDELVEYGLLDKYDRYRYKKFLKEEIMENATDPNLIEIAEKL